MQVAGRWVPFFSIWWKPSNFAGVEPGPQGGTTERGQQELARHASLPNTSGGKRRTWKTSVQSFEQNAPVLEKQVDAASLSSKNIAKIYQF
jgi:hypothetical protein